VNDGRYGFPEIDQTARMALGPGRPKGRFRHRLAGGQSVLRLPGVRSLVLADLVSVLASAVTALAVAYISYRDSKSMVVTVLVAASFSLPAAVVGMWAGRLADTHDRRRLMILTYLGTMAVWVVVVGLETAGLLNPYWLMLTAVASGVVSALRYPSWQEFVKDLVPADSLADLNAVFSSLGSVARLVGAIAGGLVITWVGESTVFVFNALSYVPLILAIAAIKPMRQVVRRPSTRRDLRQTIAYARATPALRSTITLIAVLSLLAVPVAQLLPAIATEFGSEAHYLGFLTAFYSLGASLVAWALHRIRHDYPKLRLVDQTTVACGMSLIAVALIGGILGDPGRRAAVIVLLIPIGLGVSIVQAVLTATVQLSASAEMEGEVIALYGMTVSIVAPVGAITLGAVADATQVWLSVGIGGVLLALAGLHRLLRAPARRPQLDEAQAHQATIHHARHLNRFPVGLIHSGQFEPTAPPGPRNVRPRRA
jgi:MFS family permease